MSTSLSPCHLSGSGRTAFANSSTVSGLIDNSPLRVVITVPCTPTQSPRSSRLIAANGIVAHDRFRDEELKVAGAVANGGEDQLARIAHEHDPPGDGDRMFGLGAGVEVAPLVSHLADGVCAVEAVGVRGHALRAQVVELCQPPCLLRGKPTAGL